ncbi:MAG: hypothetical protein K1X83_06560 [Oligoflexia bacterium]|nr:hypothetical protein [Oligoflexia bacterium]
MFTSGNSALQTDSKWELRVLRQEMNELKREKLHLQKKSYERQLTSWESNRMEELLDEVMVLLQQFGKLNHREFARIK